MSDQTPSSGPLADGPHDPEHDPTASYALDRELRRGPDQPARQHDRRDRRGVARRSAASRSRTSRSRRDGRRRRGVPPGAPRPGSRGRARSLDERAAALLRLHDLVLDRQDEIIDLICWESGKARKHAFDEPLHIALTARYYARTAHQHLDTERRLRRRSRC